MDGEVDREQQRADLCTGSEVAEQVSPVRSQFEEES